MNEKDTLYDKAIGYLKNSPVVVAVVIAFIAITALAAFTDSLTKLKRTFQSDEQGNSTIQSVQVSTSSSPTSDTSSDTQSITTDTKVEGRTVIGEISILELEEAISTINSDSLTNFHISEFVERNSGTKVQWECVVLDVRKQQEWKEKSDYYVVVRANSHDRHISREVMVSSFDYSKKADIAQISKDYLIKVRGKLKFIELAGNYSISLDECELISFKAPEKN
tara:strand:+ start:25 stop:693 length:669 start_codon:yes stop_codon:yes gene_type:complete